MAYMIHLHTGFRSATGSNMPRLWHPGTYPVPEHMPIAIAEQALAAGMAVKTEASPIPGVEDPELAARAELEFQRAAGGTVTEDEARAEEEGSPEPPPKRGPGRPRKTPAPENKRWGRRAG